jgi:hypothetical protein
MSNQSIQKSISQDEITQVALNEQHKNLRQVILSAQNAIRSLLPATKRYDVVEFVSSPKGYIGQHIMSSIVSLENLVEASRRAQKEIESLLLTSDGEDAIIDLVQKND